VNYSALVTAIQDYTENAFQTTDVNNFIVQAEQRVFNTIQFPSLRENVTGTLTAGNPYVSAPTDFLAAYSLAAIDTTGAYNFLIIKDVNFIREAYPNPTTSTGLPLYYAIFGPQTGNPDLLSFIVGPTPDTNYTVELHYFFYPQSITTASNGQSWLGNNFDTVLLYGALVEAYTFMKGEDDLLKMYDAKFKEALDMAKRLGDGMERQDSYRNGQARTVVK